MSPCWGLYVTFLNFKLMSMQQQLFDFIENLNLDEAFHIIRENKISFPNYQTFEQEYMLNYTAYNGTKQLAYRNSLKTFIESSLHKNLSSQLSSFNSQLSSFNPQFLTSFTPAGKVIGRQDELEELHAQLQQKENLPTVVVNGLGGIGKTTLVRKYVSDYQTHYAHIVWIEQNSSLLNAFAFQQDLTVGKEFEQKDEMTRFDLLMRFLESRQGTNLLVIDNYALTDANTDDKLLACLRDTRMRHWRVLCTSREDINGFTLMRLGVLSEVKAMELFLAYVPKEQIDETELRALLKLIDYHTLTIELLAKSYQNSLDLESLAQLTDILRQNALDAKELNRPIQIGDSQNEKRMFQHLDTVFSISNLDENALYVLKQFAVLPALPIVGKDFLKWITPQASPTETNLPTPAEQKALYEIVLQNLAKRGWLIYHKDKTFEMHRLMQMFLLRKCLPTLTDCEVLFDSFEELLNYNKIDANPLAHQWLLEYGEALLAGIDFKEVFIHKSSLENRLARLYNALGIYNQAEKWYKASLYSTEGAVGKQHEEYATRLNNLAILYKIQGRYAESELFYLEALQIDKKTIGNNHFDYAMRLSNLALLYKTQSKYIEAEPLYQEALQITGETVGNKTPAYAIILNNLAELYKVQGKYAEAEPLFKEALQIDKETISVKHPHYAIHLNNLGSMYYEMEQYNQAKALLTKAYYIRIDTLGEEHLYTQGTKEWLALVDAKL
ncbi:MAG: tetratricopeptide repeat protein [Bacteroidetes bacterium]|nr:MAG: tetratricopeptide repeat protein [Bacteroidota bacterium]